MQFLKALDATRLPVGSNLDSIRYPMPQLCKYHDGRGWTCIGIVCFVCPGKGEKMWNLPEVQSREQNTSTWLYTPRSSRPSATRGVHLLKEDDDLPNDGRNCTDNSSNPCVPICQLLQRRVDTGIENNITRSQSCCRVIRLKSQVEGGITKQSGHSETVV